MKRFALVNIKPLFTFILLLSFGSVYLSPAFAECGGNTQCIGVGASSSDALQAHHGGQNKTPVFAFGNQPPSSTSPSQTIFVAAVTGLAGNMAVLGLITITGTNPSEFVITGGSCSTSNGPVHGGALCTIDVAFSPVTAGSKAAVVNVPLNPPASPGNISGRMINLVGGAIDLSSDPEVTGLLASQAQTAMRFSRAQISNIQKRFDTLHRYKGQATPAAAEFDLDRGVDSVLAVNGYTTGFNRDLNGDQLQSSFAREFYSAVSSQSIDLSYSSNVNDQSVDTSAAIGVWVEGSVNFGTHEVSSSGINNSLAFTTEGISIGLDKPFGDKIILGLGLGFARDRTKVGTSGSQNRAEAKTLFAYGSYQLSSSFFVDALIGGSSLSYDLDRYVPTDNSLASGQRDGEQLFASVLTSYDYRSETLRLSPYARFDIADDKFDPYTETGASANAISYSGETLRSNRFSLGLLVESAHKTNFGWALPRLRAEWSRESVDDRETSVAFTNQTSGNQTTLNTIGEDRDSLLLGIGSDFIYPNGLILAVDYSLLHASHVVSDQAIGFSLSKKLDGKPLMPGFYSETTSNIPILLEAGFRYSENLNGAGIATEELSDQMYSVKLASKHAFSISHNTRLLLRGYLASDRMRRYYGLDKATLGVKAEYQFRTSGAFDAYTFGLIADLRYDDYDSALRSGNSQAIELSVRQSVTNKISIFAAVRSNVRDAESVVFDGKYNAVRMVVDYSPGRSGIVYLGAQYREGDVVASTETASYYDQIAIASAPDDAYTGHMLTATRYEAKTNIWTLGYNLPLGPRDTVDFFWMNISSKPTIDTDNVDYTSNQIGLAYFMRF